MTHSYQISGMTCDHCIQKVKKALENIQGIESVTVTLEPPQAVVTMHLHISEETMNEALAAVGNYSLKMAVHGNPGTHEHHQQTLKEKTAKADKAGHDLSAHAGNGSSHGGHNPAHGAMGHDHHRMMIADFKKRFWVSLILTVPILLLAPMIRQWLGVEWGFPGDGYLLFVLSSIVYFYGGWPFIKGFFDEIKSKSTGMMTFIAMAI